MPPTPGESLGRCRIVLADDDDLVRTVYAAALRMHGCEVYEAHDGAECVSLARARLPDLVLMDLNMPGTGGLEAVAALRADPLTEHLVVLALSADVSAGVRRRSVEAGFDAFVEKPFTPVGLVRELEAAWRDALARRGGGTALGTGVVAALLPAASLWWMV